MLLTGNFIQRGINVITSKLSHKKKEKYSSRKTFEKTVETTDGLVIAVLALILLLMEIVLMVFLFFRTINEHPPGMDRNIRLVLIVMIPEIYGVAYFFLNKQQKASFSFIK